jgi:hypothetical protein
MKDQHVYARPEAKEALDKIRQQAKEALCFFLYEGYKDKAVSGKVVREYCNAYALEIAYQGNQAWLENEGNVVSGTNEHLHPKYTLYWMANSETLRVLIDEVIRGE